jgi:hypothetical protein
MPRYTPAPWINDCGCVNGRDSNDLTKPSFDIYDAGDWHGIQDEAMGNAYLISAAPDMYEAIKYYISVLDEVLPKNWKEKPDHVLQRMFAAIAKAEGR